MKFSEGDAFAKEGNGVSIYYIITGAILDPDEVQSYYQYDKMYFHAEEEDSVTNLHSPEIKVSSFESWVSTEKELDNIPEHHPIDKGDLPKEVKEVL